MCSSARSSDSSSRVAGSLVFTPPPTRSTGLVRRARGGALSESPAHPAGDHPRVRPGSPLHGRPTVGLGSIGRVVQLRARSGPRRPDPGAARRGELRTGRRRNGPEPSDRVVARVPRRTVVVHGRRSYGAVVRGAALPQAPARWDQIRRRALSAPDRLCDLGGPSSTSARECPVPELQTMQRESRALGRGSAFDRDAAVQRSTRSSAQRTTSARAVVLLSRLARPDDANDRLGSPVRARAVSQPAKTWS